MNIDIKGIVIICGNYGSGKTETAVNLAAARKKDGIDVKIADLDLVNPYFRTREARVYLENLGIKVVLPDKQYMHADLPILAPAVAGMIRQPSELTILDAGGDDVGVTVLAALEDHLSKKTVHMLQVINPFRPFTETVQGCIKIKEEIESCSKIKITGLVSNANLIDETTPEHIYKGYDFLRDISKATGLKIEFITACSHLIPRLEMDRFTCPVLEINRKLNPPWKRI
ncbi:MAG: cobalamin biosynthesis protein CbiA [Proteobacteria bacterium]|nr:cobalamin biosynthesis protein CbiA [Pseudomonadota bacterium]MBU1585618.1 cobalamin biosynthesis protein CbiA [Pseudomonadota bacterium]MBU2631936.1 cobalamin biosynthesis protein CbiA [Pseudomonadota bacterium]